MPSMEYSDSEADVKGDRRFSGEKKEKSIWVSSLSNFSVQYNFSVIAITLKVMADKYPQNDWIKELLKGVVFAGAITGQLVMGYVGDLIGRNKALCLTISLAGIGALASGLTAWGDHYAVYGVIAATRFILGVGVGGVYPLSATKAAEESGSTDVQKRNLRVSLAFFWQTPGALFPYVFALILLFILPTAESQFRVLLAAGCIPSFFILWATMNEEESSEFRNKGDQVNTMELQRLTRRKRRTEFNPFATGREAHDEIILHDRRPPTGLWILRDRKMMFNLLGTGGCWMIYDIVYYGTSLFSPTIVGKIFGSGDNLVKQCWQNIVVQSAGIPALVCGIYVQQRFGTRNLQIAGFLAIAAAFFVLGLLFDPLKDSPGPLFFFYIVLMFMLNWGPNITTFILPAEVYPPKVRSTMNGISAALGKVGAIIGTFIYQPIYDEHGIPVLMVVAGCISLIGAALSFWTIKPSKEHTGEDDTREYNTVSVEDNTDEVGHLRRVVNDQ